MDKSIEDWKTKKYGRVITEEELAVRTSPVHPYKYFDCGLPVDMGHVDEILKGVIDVHLHGAPVAGAMHGRPTMVQTCIDASEAGMKALVFKDHNTMTNNAAVVAQDFLGRLQKEKADKGEVFTPVEVYGGITLNYQVGGMNSQAVIAALGTGRCKEVWLPSKDAKHQYMAMGLEGGIQVADGATLTPETIKVLEIITDYNNNTKGDRCALSACHVSNEEKVAVLDYVNAKGLNVDVLLDHVTQELTCVTPQEAKEMIDKGGYLEFAQCSCVPWPGMKDWVVAFDYSMNLMRELLKEKGAGHLLLITDAGQTGNVPVEGWKNFIKVLLSERVSEADINIMAKEIPAKVIGL